MSRTVAQELIGVDTEAYIFEHADLYEYAVRRVIAGETKEEAVKPLCLSAVQVPEGMHQCKKCKSRRVSTAVIQMRRADESSSVFKVCSRCQHVWKN